MEDKAARVGLQNAAVARMGSLPASRLLAAPAGALRTAAPCQLCILLVYQAGLDPAGWRALPVLQAILGAPLGMTRLMDMLGEQEVLRNEALLLLTQASARPHRRG